MMKRPFLFYLGTFWETCRFFFIFLVVSLIVNPTGNPILNLLLLWVGAGQMGSAVLFFLIGRYPEKFSSSVKFLAFWKFLGIIPSMVFSLSGIFVPKSLAVQEASAAAVFGTLIPGAILFVDFLFLVFLILYKADSGHEAARDQPTAALPDHRETRVEEED